MKVKGVLNILLADDDMDDCLLFKDALEELALGASLITVHDGERLIQHLEKVSANLPDVLFLDLNMPRKNGFECLTEIKEHSVFNKIPVIIYTTAKDEAHAQALYEKGAHYYICMPSDFEKLKNALQLAIMLLAQNTVRSTKETFYIPTF